MENFISDYRLQKLRNDRRWRWAQRIILALVILSLAGIVCKSFASVDEDIAELESSVVADTQQADLYPWEEPPVMVCHWVPGAAETIVIVKEAPELVSIVKK